ncbi:hypothetical protein NBRC10512_005599 [Rhodotorula toruloides]|uniref:RHTO0S15e01750g1_1 n=2 Tax=Rhodotorula toruloides TaxID=5286 RepID=A0A061BCU5_RHOTO|nr:uncharacterized protein RHTO_03228 [Rhodotorula toruloides NP11]EMS25499.1 hypothetical protein RHTO_03228 [Rhodotorula toruloides NP11]CDR47776.1 RHTO0S15e01750g1_1 [Rhodotorula toruloides]
MDDPRPHRLPGEQSTTLPLASFAATHAPTHPLPRLLTDPVIPRVAAVEGWLLSSKPAALLLRWGLVSERSIVLVALLGLVSAVIRWRSQWRGMLWALGVGEALGRTVRLLEREQRAATGAGGEDDDEEQHVLSFWLLFAALSLLDSLRTTPSTAAPSPRSSIFTLPTRVRDTLRSFRQTYLHFLRLYILPTALRTRFAARELVQRYPSLDPAPHLARLPSLPRFFPSSFIASPPTSSVPPRRSSTFPQPRSRPWDPLPTSLPLSWSYFAYPSSFSPSPSVPAYSVRAMAAAEARWELVKLLILWTGLRRDAFGAKSVVWDWIVGPVVGALPGRTEKETVWKVVKESRREEKLEQEPRVSQDRPRTAQDSDHSPPPSTSPFLPLQQPPLPPAAPSVISTASSAANSYTWTPRRAGFYRPSSVHPSASSTPRRLRSSSPTPSTSTAGTGTRSPFTLQSPPPGRAFALPLHQPVTTTPQGVTYRFASSQHPLLGPRAASTSAISLAAQGEGARGRGSGGRRGKRDSLLFESPPRSPVGLGESEDEGLSSEEQEADSDLDPPPTPGEQEAEEGARKWATVLAGAALDAEGEHEEEERKAGGSGWSV